MKDLQREIEMAKSIIYNVEKKAKPKQIYIAWSGGKDSTVLLHIIRSIHRGTVPFTVSFGDTHMETRETRLFMAFLSKKWHLRVKKTYLLTKKEANTMGFKKDSRELFVLLNKKYKQLQRLLIRTNEKRVLFWGNRMGDRNNTETGYIKKQKNVWFVYPLLHFTEMDIWTYIYKFHVPYNPLYEKGYRNTNIFPFLSKTNLIQTFLFRFLRVYIAIKIKLKLV